MSTIQSYETNHSNSLSFDFGEGTPGGGAEGGGSRLGVAPLNSSQNYLNSAKDSNHVVATGQNSSRNHDSEVEKMGSNKGLEVVLCIDMNFEDVRCSSSSDLENDRDSSCRYSECESERSVKSLPCEPVSNTSFNPNGGGSCRKYGGAAPAQKQFYLGSSTESIYSGGCMSSKKFESYPEGDDVKCLSLKRRLIWIRNNLTSFGFTLLFFGVNFGLFVSRAYEYRHSNVLIMGARACGQCLNFDCALLLGLILRRTITKMRNSALGDFFPCDRHIHFHKMAGWTVFLFSILHTIFHLANFAGMSVETGISLWSYLWDTSLGIGWIWGMANPSGVILLFMLGVIVAFSHRCVRKSGNFEIFYWTHLLSLPFWILMIIHGPRVWIWLLFPGTAFLLENIYRIGQIRSSRGRTHIVSSYSFASQVTKLVIRKPRDLDFKAGEYIYLNIPSVAKYEWHPFTISSAPEEEDVFMVHIRAVGGWTDKVYELFQSRNVIEERAMSPFHLPQREKRLSFRGILNVGFEPSDEEDWKHRGSRYVENLKEFNRRLSSSMGSYKAMLDDTKPKPEGALSRKKSCSMGSLSNSSKASYKSGISTPESGRSSLTGSCCSLQGQGIVDIHGEPVVFPPSIVVVTPDGVKRTLECEDSNAKTKIWVNEQDRTELTKVEQHKEKVITVYVDGPYGSPSSNIFNVNHAVLIGAGIGVTPFASILQSVMHKYREAKIPCPHCKVSSCVALPSTLRKLRKVDFIWVNRDLRHFEWFLELLANIEEEQSIQGAAMERFLRLHLYKTGNEPLQFPIPLASAIHNGRPDWDKLLGSIRSSRAGRICVYYCGPPALSAVLREKCLIHHLDFRKEMF